MWPDSYEWFLIGDGEDRRERKPYGMFDGPARSLLPSGAKIGV